MTLGDQVQPLRFGVATAALREARVASRAHAQLETPHHGTRDVLLHLQNVTGLHVVGIGPEVVAGARVNQLHGDTHPVSRAPQ